MEEMAGIEKGQKPVPSSPRVGRQSCLLAQGREKNVPQENKRQGHAENPSEPFCQFRAFPSGLRLLLCHPMSQHSCLNHTEAARLSLSSDISHVCTKY